MFCVLCMMPKAENGCYLPGEIFRVCLNCFQEATGTFPMPKNSPLALGGKFADPKALFGAAKAEAGKQLGGLMKDFSKDVVAGVKSGGLSSLPSVVSGELKEAKAAAQQKVMGGIDNLKDKIAGSIAGGKGEISKKIGAAKSKLNGKAGNLLKKADSVLGKFF